MAAAQQLAVAIRRGQLEGEGGVRRLLDAGVSASETIQPVGTPLMLAVMKNRVDIMELLVARGADVDAPITHQGAHPSYPNGWRALFAAVACDKVCSWSVEVLVRFRRCHGFSCRISRACHHSRRVPI